MKLLGSKPMRALAYVQVLNEQGVRPTAEDVRAFVEARSGMWDYSHTEGMYRDVDEYLLDARLLAVENDRVSITDAGAALVRAALNTREGPQVLEVVGRMDDPFMYAELLTRIDEMDSPMVIDPYLQPDDLRTLLRISGVGRVLTSESARRNQTKEERTRKLGIALGVQAQVPLRIANPESKELHDRLVIPQSGEALIMGTSLGGTQLTVMTKVSVETTAVLREHYEQVWRDGVDVEPIGRETSE